MAKVLVVVDMQNDFVDGALGTPEAQAIVPNVVKKIEEYSNNEGSIFITMDSHEENYLETLEGKKLPVPHCIVATEGWKINEDVEDAIYKTEYHTVSKETFGSFNLPYNIANLIAEEDPYGTITIELVGLCTDICVISNALILRAFYPDVKIAVDASCCAGTTPENHKAALTVMKCCQIDVVGE